MLILLDTEGEYFLCLLSFVCCLLLGIVTGNPGVPHDNPYPTHLEPIPPSRVRVSAGLGKGFDSDDEFHGL